jgi:hypothetical protein
MQLNKLAHNLRYSRVWLSGGNSSLAPMRRRLDITRN